MGLVRIFEDPPPPPPFVRVTADAASKVTWGNPRNGGSIRYLERDLQEVVEV